MKKELTFVPYEQIYAGFNVRLPGLANVPELQADIQENGLKEPVWLFEAKPKSFEIIRGHLRHEAIGNIARTEPTRFKELFGKGVEAIVLRDITYQQAQTEKIDHGNENPLVNTMEAQLCANLLFDAGQTEAAVATQLAGLMNRLKPMKADKRKELQTLRDDIALYQETGKFDNIAEKEKAIAQLLLDYRKGWIQNMKAIWRCPNIVMATMWLKATGERNWGNRLNIEVDDKTYLPHRLQVAQVGNKLWPAFKKDLQIQVDGKCPYNKRVPGPNFNEVWDDICAKSKAKDEEPDTPRAKAYGKAELEADGQKWLSGLAKLMCRHHARDAEVDPNQLKALDEVAYFAEIVAERAPDVWAETLTLAKNLEKEAVAEQKEVEAAEKDTTVTPPPAKAADKTEATESKAKVIRRPQKSKAKSKKKAAAK